MKKIAWLLLLVFAVVQLAPPTMAICDDCFSMSVSGEEQVEEKFSEPDKKQKKDIALFSFDALLPFITLSKTVLLSELVTPPPTLERLTPPPNFC